MTVNPDSLRYGYIRVSRASEKSRNLETQRQALLDYGIRPELTYSDVQSGRTMERDGWLALLEVVQPGDVICVTYLDRLCRSVEEGLSQLKVLRERGVGVIAVEQDLDIRDSNPFSQLIINFMLVIDEWYRETSRVRSVEGQQRARSEGRLGGRPRKLNDGQRNYVYHQVKVLGRSKAELAREFEVSRPAIVQAVKAVEAELLKESAA